MDDLDRRMLGIYMSFFCNAIANKDRVYYNYALEGLTDITSITPKRITP